MKNFTSLDDLSDGEISELLRRARFLEDRRETERYRGLVLGLLMLNPSVRTLSSFQTAMAHLGGSSFVVQPGQGSWAFEFEDEVTMDGLAAEHAKEAIPVLSQYADILGVRAFPTAKTLLGLRAEQVLNTVVEHSSVPVINLESSLAHPCQALADWKTLDDLAVARSKRFTLSWAWHQKALPLAVPLSTLRMASRRGMEVTVLRPEGWELPEEEMASIRSEAKRCGGSLVETDNREEAMQQTTVLYAKSWGSPRWLDNPEEEERLKVDLKDWQVTPSWFDRAAEDAVFMHCLPVRRNLVVSDSVLDGPRSRVIPQAGNRLHVQKAILDHLLGAAS